MTALSEHQRPRTLTEALRAMSAEQLSALLELRPDLLDPVPHDIAELASRSTMSTSIARAIDELNAWLRTVAEALAALSDPASLADLATMLGQPRSTGAAAIGQLRERALLWGEDDQLHLVRPVREAFEPYPGGLAPPSARPDVGRADRGGTWRTAAPRPASYWNDFSGRRPGPYATPTAQSAGPPPGHRSSACSVASCSDRWIRRP